MTIAEQLQQLHQQIAQTEQSYQRIPGSVKILAVSKGQAIYKIHAAMKAAQNCFGENYYQEAIAKIHSLEQFPLEWHFIGTLQSNKTRHIAQYFSWVHSLDNLKIAERLSQQRPEYLPKLNVCIEVNISQQYTKGGVTPAALLDLAFAVSCLQNLHLRGLMAIPKPSDDFAEQLANYQLVQALQNNLCSQGLTLDTLSMGMSHDYIAAIAAGSTMVRLGTAIFGPRSSK